MKIIAHSWLFLSEYRYQDANVMIISNKFPGHAILKSPLEEDERNEQTYYWRLQQMDAYHLNLPIWVVIDETCTFFVKLTLNLWSFHRINSGRKQICRQFSQWNYAYRMAP